MSKHHLEKVTCPECQNADGKRLLHNHTDNHAVSGSNKFEHGNTVEFIQSQGVKNECHNHCGNGNQNCAEKQQLFAGACHKSAQHNLPLFL